MRQSDGVDGADNHLRQLLREAAGSGPTSTESERAFRATTLRGVARERRRKTLTQLSGLALIALAIPAVAVAAHPWNTQRTAAPDRRAAVVSSPRQLVPRVPLGTCPREVPFSLIPDNALRPIDLRRGASIRLGVRFPKPSEGFLLKELRIDVLPPGVAAQRSFRDGQKGSLQQGTLPYVYRYVRVNEVTPVGDIATTFGGRDTSGRLLPSGLYAVGFSVKYTGLPGTACGSRDLVNVSSGQLALLHLR